MLELSSPDGAFERIEAYLRERGFFAPGGEELEADLYLGYGLSAPLRRHTSPLPPEPCPLPLRGGGASASVTQRHVPRTDLPTIGSWERSWADAEYAASGRGGARGDRARRRLPGQPRPAPERGVRRRSGRRSPRRLAAFGPRTLAGDGWAIVSASPELFLARRGRRVWTCPIKGTRPLGEHVEGEKDSAEHVMIVDLERNDLSRVCEPGSVRWPELMVERELAGVTHLVSTVEGTLRDDVGLAELLAATFPGGSVTGAPKIAAVDLIAELEPVGRGASMGALGTVRGNGDLELALTIRTFAIADGRIHLWVGGGIVWDSDPEAEIEESWTKAAPAARRDRRPDRGGRAMSLLAVAVGGRGVVDPAEPVLRADDEALLRGRGAFETIRVYAGASFRLAEHLERLARSAERIGLPPVNVLQLRELAPRRSRRRA